MGCNGEIAAPEGELGAGIVPARLGLEGDRREQGASLSSAGQMSMSNLMIRRSGAEEDDRQRFSPCFHKNLLSQGSPLTIDLSMYA